MKVLSGWKSVGLHDICKPKQWKTISSSQLKDNGYLVYGANGPIGRYHSFNHEAPTILIGCRGTCGAVTVSEPRSWVTGNAMALDDLDTTVVNLRYLVQALRADGLKAAVTGTSQPQITQESLRRISIPLPPIQEQRRIASVLDAADALRTKRRLAFEKLDLLTQSIFINMFGDPVSNQAGWPEVAIGQLGRVVTGRTPPGTKRDMFGDDVPFVTPGDLDSSTPVARWLSLEGARNSRLVPAGSTFVCCIGATIGKVGEAPVESAFNQQINAVDWDRTLILPEYGTRVMRFMKTEIVRRGASTTLPLLNKTDFSQLKVPLPPMDIQTGFRDRVRSLNAVRTHWMSQERQLDALFASLRHRAFRGEL